MIAPSPAANAVGPEKNDRDAALAPMLLVLTVVTGLVDAVSYLKLGHVFVANMTGNVVFLGFAVAGAEGFSVPASLVAIAAFLLGALAGGRLGSSMTQHRGGFVAIAILVELVLVGAAWVVAITVGEGDLLQYGLIVLLAVAMGVQNAAARLLAVPDLTTTVLTLTLTGFAADSRLAGGSSPRRGRKLLAVAAMLLGAAVGAFCVLKAGVAATLGLTCALLGGNVIAACVAWKRSAT